VPVEVREQACVDRPRGADRQLLADDRPDERRVGVARCWARLGRPVLVEQPREDRIRRAQVIERAGYGWPSTEPGTPVLVE
jgi:hypothetical protein